MTCSVGDYKPTNSVSLQMAHKIFIYLLTYLLTYFLTNLLSYVTQERSKYLWLCHRKVSTFTVQRKFQDLKLKCLARDDRELRDGMVLQYPDIALWPPVTLRCRWPWHCCNWDRESKASRIVKFWQLIVIYFSANFYKNLRFGCLYDLGHRAIGCKRACSVMGLPTASSGEYLVDFMWAIRNYY